MGRMGELSELHVGTVCILVKGSRNQRSCKKFRRCVIIALNAEQALNFYCNIKNLDQE
jgi:hypothetical protein